MLISTGLPPPMCSSMSESEAFAPSAPRCSVARSPRLIPLRESVPGDQPVGPGRRRPVYAGSETVRFSLPLSQK